MEVKNIGIIGTGGVGGYFGGKLCLNPAADVYFIARGQHLKAIQEQGLLLSSEQGEFICRPTLATDQCTDLPVLDLALICVKSYDLEAVLSHAGCAFSENTILLPLLNGVDIHERIRRILPAPRILPACVYIGTHIEKPGKVVQKGGSCIISLGPDPTRRYPKPVEVLSLFEESGIRYQWLEDPFPAIWTKFLFIAPFGLVTACYDKTIGQVRESEELTRLALSMMQEIITLAKKKGIQLPPSILADILITVKNFPYETRTSFQRDFANADKPDERDILGGTLVRLGREYGVPTPVAEDLLNRLQRQKKLDI
jgi:2-dehydropantoate 2-reductase